MNRRPDLPRLSDDPYLGPYLEALSRRAERSRARARDLCRKRERLSESARLHETHGLHRTSSGWSFCEWAPHAESLCMVGTFSDWKESSEYALSREADGCWSLSLPPEALQHGDLYRLRVRWPGGDGDRIPACARRVVQDEETHICSAQVWCPEPAYAWQHSFERPDGPPLVYEAHVGMAQEREGVGSYEEFRRATLPRIADAGYNTIQLMAVIEHPYYASFGYHVSSFFAASSRFGTPEELKALIDEAHGAGLAVTMDLVHSHAVRNEAEGLSRFDGTLHQYFHEGDRGYHAAWDSRCFNYGKPEVLRFLLSNCRFWLEEYHVDGFRFDGVTSMLYLDHGLGRAFTSYGAYFDDQVDEDAVVYLALANQVIHEVRPDAMTVAEDVSGMPGLAAPVRDGGCGFDYRLAMGVADCWFKLVNDVRDEAWDLGTLWHELTNKRQDERAISYVECHDQALVGGKSLIFELLDAEMYGSMCATDTNPVVDRGIALHKMARLATLATAGDGYLNFMGNEFGHPEWVDFPREGNHWSYHYARRQWHLRDDTDLKYHFLADFDRAMLALAGELGLSTRRPAVLRYLHQDDMVLVFERGKFLFLFNFHPAQSVSDYAVAVMPGEYSLEMDTDEQRFGGQGRLAPAQHYFSRPAPQASAELSVYLPCRVALVLRKL